jgi:hypothetical protein
MPEKYITVAGFADPFEAEIARGRLESDGIPAIVNAGLTASMFSGNSNIGGRVELSVPADRLARAVQILAECGSADHLTDEVRAEGDDDPVWVCPLCGDPVRAVLPICPACYTPRGQAPAVDPGDDADEPEEGIQTHPMAGIRTAAERTEDRLKKPGDVAFDAPLVRPEVEADSEVEGLQPPTTEGDAIARRACYAALFGPAAAGLLSVYSLWLLVQLGFHGGELSRRGLRHMNVALGINIAYALLFVLLCAG